MSKKTEFEFYLLAHLEKQIDPAFFPDRLRSSTYYYNTARRSLKRKKFIVYEGPTTGYKITQEGRRHLSELKKNRWIQRIDEKEEKQKEDGAY